MRKDSQRCSTCWGDGTAGSGNPNWRGGVTKHKAGYVMRKAAGHPRATSNGGYVFEHILVMEELLGRYLVPGETVHHLNGIKDDNRIENLELWTKPQPSGIRAREAYEWATIIIQRYDSLYGSHDLQD